VRHNLRLSGLENQESHQLFIGRDICWMQLTSVNFVKSLFSVRSKFQEAQAKIDVAIETYTSTIVDLGAMIGLQLFRHGKHIEEKIDNISTHFQQFFRNVDNRCIGIHALSAADS
jgi:hypothetical protein